LCGGANGLRGLCGSKPGYPTNDGAASGVIDIYPIIIAIDPATIDIACLFKKSRIYYLIAHIDYPAEVHIC
jgi:hypothetical protein